MPCRQHVGAEILGRLEEIRELDLLVAGDAGDRRLAGNVALGEWLDHLFAEALLVIEHVMGNAEPRGDVARVVDVLTGAAGAFAMRRRAVVVELQRHADDIVALGGQKRRDDRGIDPARHGDDDAGLLRPLGEAEAVKGARGKGGVKRKGYGHGI